ncbi:MAG TPA: 3-phosphoshikimate 1-carboxyvinyltransferase [Acidimicrobiales bacterium]|nr:3-phosphoshikimate 1-carboxyvinyltransferase [Acidimicrobiales bacterium]
MSELVVSAPARPLRGRLRIPGDKSISHRAVLLAARAQGRSSLRGLSNGLDVRHTLDAVAACGAAVSSSLAGDDPVTIEGGASRLHEPAAVIDVGNSGTGIRLLAGWSAGLPWLTVLQGDASIAERPMGRVTSPLREMRARIDGRADGRLPPLVIRGGGLRGIDYSLPVASAQVKGAILLAGLSAAGPTIVREAVPTRAHTEELLAMGGADLAVEPGVVTLQPSTLRPFELNVPGDPSQAAFWVVAACLVPGSDLVVEHVYVGQARAGFLNVLRRMGADIALENEDPVEHTADIRARATRLRATSVGGPEVPGLIDEIPVLAVAAALAEGPTTFADAGELVVKESDRITSIVSGLRALGVKAEPRPDGLVVEGSGGRPLTGGSVDAYSDHRIAMAMAVAGLAATGATAIEGSQSVASSYPSFEEDLRRCVS